MATVRIDTRTAFLSKINWTAATGGLSMLIVFFGGTALTPEQQAAIITTIGLSQSVLTWILRTWFTTTVTPSSMGTTGVA